MPRLATFAAMTVLPASELEATGNRFARLLDTLGVPTRGGVAALAGNVPELLAAYRGTTWSGRRFTPLSWRWTADDVEYVVGNCEADVLVVDARHASLATSAAALVPAPRRIAIGAESDGFRPWAACAS